jgi:hypothetical protein
MNRSHMRWPLVFGIVVMATTASRTATSQKLEVAVKDRANAYASLAAAGPFAAMAWGASSKDGATDICVAVSRDGGRAFATPTRVAGDAKLTGEQPPRVALVPRAGRTPSMLSSGRRAGRQAHGFSRLAPTTTGARSRRRPNYRAVTRPATAAGNRYRRVVRATWLLSGSIIVSRRAAAAAARR